MAQTMHIEDLREILAQAAARDEALQHDLEAFATDFLKAIGAGDKPVWVELKAAKGERQVTPNFVMAARALTGELVIEVTPEVKVSVTLKMLLTKDKTHEVGTASEPSQSVVIDPPDPKKAEQTKQKLFEHIFANLEGQIRRIVDLPAA